MRKQLLALGAAVALLLATSAGAASRGVEFTPLGLFEDEGFPLTTAVDISGDGSTIVGMHALFSGNYVWTAETGLQTIGPVDGAPWISTDGTTIATTPYIPPDFDYSQSAVWAGGFWPNQTWNLIPTAPGFAFCDLSGQSTFNINGDGSVVVGLTWIDFDMNGDGCDGARAFVSQGGVTTVLDDSVNNDSSRANAVNGDGSVIVGWMQTFSREATKWVNGVESFLCPNPIGAGGDMFCDEGWDVTPDGSCMLTSAAGPTDFTLRAAIVDDGGNLEMLPFPDAFYDPFWDTFSPRAISADCNTVVGSFGGGGFFGSPPYPVVWNRNLGITIDLQVFLLGQGLDDLFFWFLSDADAVSSDGTVIAGYGSNPDGWLEAFRVDLGRVKVCHKPDGNGTGSDRTIAIGWDSVANHLGHGDALATCEFLAADGASRTAGARRTMVEHNKDAAYDRRIGTIEQMNRIQKRIAGESPFGSSLTVANPYPVESQEDGKKAATGGQTEQQRTNLRERVSRSRSGE
jgi:uncharacterized membrane protein